MNTVGVAVSSAGAYMYVRLCTYVMHYCICVIWCRRKRKKPLCQDHKINTWSTRLHNTSCKHSYFWKWVASNHGGSSGAKLECGTLSHVFSGLISMLVFDILQIPSRCINFCSGRTAPTCTPWLRASHVFRLLLWVLGKMLNYLWFPSCYLPYADNVADRVHAFYRLPGSL